MVFSSIIFLFFFLVAVLAVYFLSPGIRIKNFVLMVFSLLFYAWGEGELVLLMVLSSLFNYGIAFWIDLKRATKIPLIIGLAVNLIVLIYYKYIGLLVGSFDNLFGTHFNNGINIHLPIGISFFTFHSMSYIIDIYKKKTGIQKNPLNMILYISLFPQLVAGPIVRYSEIEHEIMHRKHTLLNFVNGTKRFCLGLAKKVLIANVLGEIADELFSMQTNEMYFATSWFAIIAYSLQIYFDFSGYSDMGIGLGQVFGFNFPENFNFPYIAKSIKEFWRRWHMTLSRWFRDYLYIPLGGSHKGNYRTYFNLFIVFFATGLWHGATWNFVLWGLFHGLFLIIERLGFEKTLNKAPIIGHVYTLLVVVFAWVLFRIPSFEEAVNFYRSLFLFEPIDSKMSFMRWVGSEQIIIFIIAIFLCMPLRGKIEFVKMKIRNTVIIEIWDYSAMVFYFILLLLSIMSISSTTYNPFIYFRF